MKKNEVQAFDKALKNILYVLVRDFKRFEDLERYNYELTKEHFKGIGSLLFRTAKKYKSKGMNRLTGKIFNDEGIKESDVKEYFNEVDKEASVNFSLYIEEVQAYLLMEEIDKTAKQLIKARKVVSGKDVFEKANQYIGLIQNKTTGIKGLKKNSEGFTMLKLNKEFKELKEDRTSIKTGVKAVDEHFPGWKRSGINLLSGVSNQGKTTFAIQCILYAVIVLDLRVLFINLEMKESDIYAKIMGLLSREGYSAHNIESYNHAIKEDRENHKKRAEEDEVLIREHIKEKLVIKAGTYSDEMLYQELKDAEAEEFDLVLVDYFQLVETGTDNGKMKAQKLSELQENVRGIVRNCSYAFVWLTQLKEDTEKDKEGKLKVQPMEYEIAWTRDLYKGADSELRVWREYENIETRTFKPSMFVGFKKTRFMDRVEPVELGFDGAVGRVGNFIEVKSAEEILKEKEVNPFIEDDYFDDYSDTANYFPETDEEFDLFDHWEKEAKELEEDRKRIEEFKKEQEEERNKKEEEQNSLDEYLENIFNDECSECNKDFLICECKEK